MFIITFISDLVTRFINYYNWPVGWLYAWDCHKRKRYFGGFGIFVECIVIDIGQNLTILALVICIH